MSEDRTRHADVLREVRDCLVGWIERRDRSDPARPSNDEVLAALAAGIAALEAPALPEPIAAVWALVFHDDRELVWDRDSDYPMLFESQALAEVASKNEEAPPDLVVPVLIVPASPAVPS